MTIITYTCIMNVIYIHNYIVMCFSQEVEEARTALHAQSASFEQLQSQLKEMQEQLDNEEKARDHARMLQRSV